MGNCLKTQLKENVNNSSLLELDVLRFENVNTNGVNRTWALLGGYKPLDYPVIVEFEDGNGGMADYGTTSFSNPYSAYSESARIYKTTSSSTIRIRNKYNLGYFKGGPEKPLNSSEFAYCTELRKFGHNKLTGSIEDFAKCTKVSELSVNNSTTLKGNIVTLVKKWIQNGRNASNTTGVTISFQNSLNVKFGNSSLLPTFGAGQILYWESNQKIYAVQQFSTEVFCVGYTSEEIAANKAGTGTVNWSGKTVIKCD